MKIEKIIRIAFADEIFSFVPYRIDDKRSTFETHASKEIMEQVFDYAYDSGIYSINNKWGIINIKTGEIIAEPFADDIYGPGVYRLNNKE